MFDLHKAKILNFNLKFMEKIKLGLVDFIVCIGIANFCSIHQIRWGLPILFILNLFTIYEEQITFFGMITILFSFEVRICITIIFGITVETFPALFFQAAPSVRSRTRLTTLFI